MQKITNVKIDVKKVEKIIVVDPIEGHCELGTEYTIRIYEAFNPHLSRQEIGRILKMGISDIDIMEVI